MRKYDNFQKIVSNWQVVMDLRNSRIFFRINKRYYVFGVCVIIMGTNQSFLQVYFYVIVDEDEKSAWSPDK